jgi:peptidoglycan/xylan/chitin deacetylase (PgdA/CDA1 family)
MLRLRRLVCAPRAQLKPDGFFSINYFMPQITMVTTSWDDGHPCDLRLAEMLAKSGLPATFYIPIFGENGKPVLGPATLRTFLNQGFEIGAHTVTHQELPTLDSAGMSREVCRSKELLQDQLGEPVRMFCYPRGRYDSRVIGSVVESGFLGARTTRMFSKSLKFGRFEMPTTLQAFPHPPLNYLKNLGKRRDLPGLARYFSKYAKCGSWVEMGKSMFDEVVQEGGIWHLYGHSWELDDLGLWDQLQELFSYVANRPGVIYATNSKALEIATEAV